jgi:hypothetical protein
VVRNQHRPLNILGGDAQGIQAGLFRPPSDEVMIFPLFFLRPLLHVGA